MRERETEKEKCPYIHTWTDVFLLQIIITIPKEKGNCNF